MNHAQIHAVVEPRVKADMGHGARWGSYRELALSEEDTATMAAQYMGEVHDDEGMSRFIVTELHDGSHAFHWN